MYILLHGLLILPLGFILGLFYFSCLWFTVQNLPQTRHPILLMVGSAVIRLSVALLGFYLMIGGQWINLLIALLGFLLARSESAHCSLATPNISFRASRLSR
jgi:F1F0 ATPase subunit 2